MKKIIPSLILGLIVNSTVVDAEQPIEQNSDKDDSYTLDKIVVAGSKLDITVQELESSVEVFDRERLEAENIVDLEDLLLRVPNVSSSGGSSTFSIRGIQRRGVAGVGVASNVYVDGLPLSGVALSRGLSTLWDVEQAEVLRGSQSSVQGRNALAGAIIISTADPKYYQEGKVQIKYGSFDTFQASGAYNIPIVDDQLAARLAVDIQKSNGFIEHTIAGKNSDFRDQRLFRGKLLFEPNAIDDLTMKLILERNEGDNGESRPIVSTGLGVTEVALQDFDFFDFKASGRFPQNEVVTTRTILDTELGLSDVWTFKNLLTYENTEADRSFGVRELFEEFEGFTFNQFDERVYSNEIRLEFDKGNVSAAFGGYYLDSLQNNITNNEVSLQPQLSAFGGTTEPSDAVVGVISANNARTKNYALFGQVRWDINPNWILDLSLRYDNEEYEIDGISQQTFVSPENCLTTVPGFLIGAPVDTITLPCQTLVDAILGGDPDLPPEAASFNAWLPRIALTRKLSEDHSIFALLKRGYRAGGTQVVSTPNPEGLGNINVTNSYDPEFLTTFEIGSRSKFMDGTLTLNTNVFYSKYKDQQVSIPGPIENNFSDDLIVNAAESTLYGAEVAIDYQISSNWNTYASLGLLETEFNDFPFATQGRFQNLKGNALPQAPNVTATIGANWENVSGWFTNFSVNYAGSQSSEVDDLTEQDFTQAFIDAGLDSSFASGITERIGSAIDVAGRFGYRGDNHSIYLYGTNLLDEDHITSISYGNVNNETGEVSLANQDVTATVRPPRALGISFNYNF